MLSLLSLMFVFPQSAASRDIDFSEVDQVVHSLKGLNMR